MDKRKFKKRVYREQRLAIREMRDGCLDCRECRGLCAKHYHVAVGIALHPKEFLNLKGK